MPKLPLGLEYLIMDEKEEKIRCPECGSKYIREERGDLVCKECGLVIEERLTRQVPEKKDNDPEKKHIAFLYKVKDTFFNPTEARDRKKYLRINNINRWSSSEEKAYGMIYNYVSRFKKHFGSTVIDDVADLSFWAYKKGLSKGRGVRFMVAGSLYAVLKMHRIPIFAGDVARILKEEYDDEQYDMYLVVRGYDMLLKEIYSVVRKKANGDFRELIIKVNNALKPRVPARNYIDTYFSKLGIEKQEYAAKLERLIGNRDMKPGLLAGGVYLFFERGIFDSKTCENMLKNIMKYTNKKTLTQDSLAEFFNISDVTLRTYFNELKDLEES